MMERADSSKKLYSRLRLWELPDQYIVEPTDGSFGSFLVVSRKDGSMSLIGELIMIVIDVRVMLGSLGTQLFFTTCFDITLTWAYYLHCFY